MSFALTEEELRLCLNLPEDTLIDLAAELDLIIPEVLSRADLLASATTQIVDRAAKEGLPFSKYDREDLQALPPEHLTALAKLCRASTTVDGLIRSGQKVYRMYQRQRPDSQVALILPMLLSAVARCAAEKS